MRPSATSTACGGGFVARSCSCGRIPHWNRTAAWWCRRRTPRGSARSCPTPPWSNSTPTTTTCCWTRPPSTPSTASCEADDRSPKRAPAQRETAQVNTYSPGPLASTLYLLLPIVGGSIIGPACSLDHAAQSTHHDPALRLAACFHSSGLAGFSSAARNHALGPGGLTMPAMCPPLLSTNRAGPENSPVVL